MPDITDLGNFCLLLGLVITGYGMVAGPVGVWLRRREFVDSAERSMLMLCGVTTVAMLLLTWAFLADRFDIRYVASHSSSSLPLFYKLTAVWAGMEGSLLFWLWLLTVYAAVAVVLMRKRHPTLIPYAVSVLFFVAGLFLVLASSRENPFALTPVPLEEGRGMNPILQDPAMAIHPPTLYIGLVGFAVPFAFAMAALITKQLDATWIRAMRRFTLFPWMMLGIGILLGAHWAYVELGWGGYWAWDPVENASIMPWLAATAYLHSVMIQEKKHMLKMWNMILVVITFEMSIFGTFLTRSGIMSSVHTFTGGGLGWYFIVFMALSAAGAGVLMVLRSKLLRSEDHYESYVSREASFLFNNLILIGALFSILWGTLFPVLSEAFGRKITVGPPFFNQVNIPIGLFLLFLTGVGPVIAWRKATVRNLQKSFLVPVAVGAIAAILLAALGMRDGYALTSLGLAAFVLTTIVSEFSRGARARHRAHGESIPFALLNLVNKNRRRYGGYVVHVGIVLIFIGITGAAFNAEKEATVKRGESFELKDYVLTYVKSEERFAKPKKARREELLQLLRNDRLPEKMRERLLEKLLEDEENEHYSFIRAFVNVSRNGKPVAQLVPEKRYYFEHDQPTTEASLHSTLSEDIYLVIAMGHKDGSITFKAYANPLVVWIWLGGFIFVAGTGIALWPERRHAAAASAAIRYRSAA